MFVKSGRLVPLDLSAQILTRGASASISHLDELGGEDPRVGAVAAYLRHPPRMRSADWRPARPITTQLDAVLAGGRERRIPSLADGLGCYDDRLL
jgi:hypothetical protein